MSSYANQKLQELLQEAKELNASDIHLLVDEPPVFRVGGALQRDEKWDPLLSEDVEALIAAAFGSQNAGELVDSTGCAIALCEAPGIAEGRICVTKADGQLTACIRILPAKLSSAKDARVPDALLEAACAPSGLIVVAGETGSGKTTVALMLLEHLNASKPVHILTIEDPITFRLKSKQAVIRQQSVGIDTPSYAAALRACLRQDPDVIFVGEVRDLMTLEACITAANTGHLVITQIHASSPEDVIQRMIEVHPEEMRASFRRQLAMVLRAVSIQKLLPRAETPGCVAAFGLLVVDKEMRKAIAESRDITDPNFSKPAGCQNLADDIRKLLKNKIIKDDAAAEVLASLE